MWQIFWWEFSCNIELLNCTVLFSIFSVWPAIFQNGEEKRDQEREARPTICFGFWKYKNLVERHFTGGSLGMVLLWLEAAWSRKPTDLLRRSRPRVSQEGDLAPRGAPGDLIKNHPCSLCWVEFISSGVFNPRGFHRERACRDLVFSEREQRTGFKTSSQYHQSSIWSSSLKSLQHRKHLYTISIHHCANQRSLPMNNLLWC